MRKLGAFVAGLLLWMVGFVALAFGLWLWVWQRRPDGEFIFWLVMVCLGVVQAIWVIPLAIVARRRRALLAGILLGAALGVAGSARLLLSAPNAPIEARVFLAQDFQIQHRWEEIPAPTRRAFFATVGESCQLQGGECRMANEGEPWNETDLNTDDRLPYRRLIAAGESGQQAFLFFEMGGINGGQPVLVVFDKRGGALQPSWWSVVWTRFRSPSMLKAWLRYGRESSVHLTDFQNL